ncbi:MAG: serine hydrolase domain-containing protein [Bacteroidota bacterium]
MRNIIVIASLVIGLIFIFLFKSFAQKIEYPAFDQIESIDTIVQPFLANDYSKALSIGVLKDGKMKFYNFGKHSDDRPDLPTQQNIYEIGSITKTFTASVLVQMVEEGLVQLDDPISKYLPEGVVNLEGDKIITLQDLSSHHSGLPRLASNFFATVTDMNNPYTNYKEKDLYDFLKTFKGVSKEKREVAYSNVGVDLLGHILSLVAEQSYEEMITERIFQPLEMNNSTITFGEKHLEQLIKGHNPSGKITANWDFPHFGGAGAIRSTTEDMLQYLNAQLQNKTFTKAHEVRLPMGETSKIGLGWITTPSKNTNENIIWHNGGTGGYRSFAGFIKEHNLGVVVLNNTTLSVDEIGILVLDYLVKEKTKAEK